ncbi:MAG: hypothetical protein ACC654_11710 [Acidimicrobiia bacterium]
MVAALSSAMMAVKRALLPLMPDVVMERYRYHREQLRALLGLDRDHSLSRSNVDVIVQPSDARRWLLSTPDTFRIVDVGVTPTGVADIEVFPAGSDIGDLVRFVGWQRTAAVVTGRVEVPKWGNKTGGTRIEPTSITIDRSVLTDVGEPLSDDSPLPELLSRIVGAGYKFALVPETTTHIDSARRDRIDLDTVVILAAVPLHDVGGGSRGAQLALELVHRGSHVIYVNRYPSYETTELGLRFIHPHLEQTPFGEFTPGDLTDRCDRSGVVIVEIPDPGYMSAVSDLKTDGWRIVFDIIDDWSDRALGGEWFDQPFEDSLIQTSDVVIASAADLVTRATRVGRTDVVLVPNGVNATIFDGTHHDRPRDLPADPIIGYHGSLYGDWIDWQGIRTVADTYPASSVVLIGENRNTPPDLPTNVVFLGLKPQNDLPAYLQHFDVGFVPFKVSATTHAVSPLKVYEYLASGVPVAAPPLRSLSGLSGVHCEQRIEEAVASALIAERPDPSDALATHSWGTRLTAIFAALGETLPEAESPPVRIEQRPVTHYRWRERRLKN